MVSPTSDRRMGLAGNAGFKTPVTALAAGNIALHGEQNVDGVAVLASNAAGQPDRVVCVGQTDPKENGIWDVSAAAWTRSLDANGNYDLRKGTTVVVTSGNTYAGTYWSITSSDPITVGTTSITWARALASSISTQSFLQAGAGTVARGAQDKMREIVSLEDFAGVDPTGVAVSTAGVQAAFNSAAGAIWVNDDGVFKLDGTITLSTSKIISGRGELRWTSGITHAPAINVTADHCDFDGVYLTNPNLLQGQSGLRNYGILFDANFGRVLRSRIRYFQQGVTVDASGEFTNFVIADNFIEDCIGAGDGPANAVSTFGEDRGDGITVWGAHATISGNVVTAKAGQDCRIGIHAEGLSTFEVTTPSYSDKLVTISGNTVLGTFRRSIVFEQMDNSVIVGNTVAGATWWGIALARTKRSSVVGNSVFIDRATGDQSGAAWAPDYAGILTYGACEEALISGNTVDITTGDADGINFFGSAGDRGVGGSASNNSIMLNPAKNRSAVKAALQDDLTVIGNRGRGINHYGIYGFDVSRPLISGNNLIGSAATSDGIHLEANATPATVTSNQVRGFSGGIGISISGRVGGVCHQNTVVGSATGIDFFGTTYVSYGGNYLDGNTAGLTNVGGAGMSDAGGNVVH